MHLTHTCTLHTHAPYIHVHPTHTCTLHTHAPYTHVHPTHTCTLHTHAPYTHAPYTHVHVHVRLHAYAHIKIISNTCTHNTHTCTHNTHLCTCTHNTHLCTCTYITHTQHTHAHHSHSLPSLFLYSLLFWVNQASHFRIERCNLDGSNRMVIVNSTGAINDIIVDYPSNMLLWVDNENHNFRTSNLDGTNQSIFIPISSEPRFTAQPFGMAKLGNQLFWTEWQTRSLYRALQTGKSSFLLSTVAPFKTQQPNSIAVVNRLRPGGNGGGLVYSNGRY